jgi:hypothetical protein
MFITFNQERSCLLTVFQCVGHLDNEISIINDKACICPCAQCRASRRRSCGAEQPFTSSALDGHERSASRPGRFIGSQYSPPLWRRETFL